MAELRGGTTIAGYTALHSGLKEAYLSGNLTMGGNITIPANGQIISAYNGAHVLKDFNNGHITLSAAGGTLYLGYQNTQYVRLYSNLVYGTSTLIADTAGKLYYQGQDLDVRYMNSTIDAYLGTDLTGSTSYPRMTAKNSGASTPNWIRVGDSGGYGLLPYANNVSSLGTSSWQFQGIYGTTLYEGGTALASKYSDINHNHDSSYVDVTGDTMSGNLTISNNNWPVLKLNATTAGQDPVVSYQAPGGTWDERNDDSNANVFEWRWNNVYKMRLGTAGDLTIPGTLNVISGPDVTLAGGGGIVIGPTTGGNLAMDANEIQARNNGAAGSLNLNVGGGNVYMGMSGGYVQATPEVFGIGVDTQNTYFKMGSRDVIASKYGSTSGNGIVIGSGGLTIIGAGESHGYLWDSGAVVAGTETLFLTSDNDITIYPDQNAGYSTKNKVVIDGGAETTLKLYNTQAVSGSTGNVGLELRAEGGGLPYIDFARSTSDYTTRLIVDTTNNLTLAGGGDFQTGNVKTYGESKWLTADSTGGWHVIAYNGTQLAPTANTGGDRAYGTFTIINEDASRHMLIQFTAGTAFNKPEGVNLKMLGKVMFGGAETFGAIRISTRSTYDIQYLEVWVEPSVRFRVIMEDNYFMSGWNLLSTPQKSVTPNDYTVSKLEMQSGYEGIPKNITSGTVAAPSNGMFKGDIYIQY